MKSLFKIVLLLAAFNSTNVTAESTVEKEFKSVAGSLKGKIFMLYNKALKADPNISGKTIFEIKINDQGKVESCKAVKSQYKNASLETGICDAFKSKSFTSLSVLPYRAMHEISLYSTK